jgi:hypothetical protein
MSVKNLLIGGCLAMCVAACATNPPAPAVAKAADTPPPGCVADTATRLPVTAHQCATFGRSFSGSDIRATGVGASDVGSGLKMLDPSVSTNGIP